MGRRQRQYSTAECLMHQSFVIRLGSITSQTQFEVILACCRAVARTGVTSSLGYDRQNMVAEAPGEDLTPFSNLNLCTRFPATEKLRRHDCAPV